MIPTTGLHIPTQTDLVGGCDDGPIIARMRLAGVPEHLQYCAFDSSVECRAIYGYSVTPDMYPDRADFQTMHVALAEVVGATHDSAGVWLEGNNRVGKSHLAAAQVRASASDCFWIREGDFADFVYASKKPGNTAPTVADLIAYLTHPTTQGWRTGPITRLILDDMGTQTEGGTFWVTELFKVVEACMAAGMTLTVTTNMDQGALVEALGPRIGERLIELAGAPIVLVPRTHAAARRPVRKAALRCTCTAHYPAFPPVATSETVSYTNADGKVTDYIKPTMRNIFPELPAMWKQPIDAKDTTPPEVAALPLPEMARINQARWATLRQTYRNAPMFQQIRGDVPDSDTAPAPGQSSDGSFCHRETPCTDADRTDAEWYGVHASRWHKPYPPQAVEPAQEPQAEAQAS